MCYCYVGPVGPYGSYRREYPTFREAFLPSPPSASPLCLWVGFLRVGCLYRHNGGGGISRARRVFSDRLCVHAGDSTVNMHAQQGKARVTGHFGMFGDSFAPEGFVGMGRARPPSGVESELYALPQACAIGASPDLSVVASDL